MDIHEFAEILITRGRTIIMGVRDMAIIIGVRVTVTVRHMVRARTPDGATSLFGICGHGSADPCPAKRDRFSLRSFGWGIAALHR
jgi:hypothetical protein